MGVAMRVVAVAVAVAVVVTAVAVAVAVAVVMETVAVIVAADMVVHLLPRHRTMASKCGATVVVEPGRSVVQRIMRILQHSEHRGQWRVLVRILLLLLLLLLRL